MRGGSKAWATRVTAPALPVCLGHVEEIVASLGGAGPEGEGLTAQVDPGDLRLGDPGHGLNRGEVLGPEPRLGAPGPDTFDPDRHPR